MKVHYKNKNMRFSAQVQSWHFTLACSALFVYFVSSFDPYRGLDPGFFRLLSEFFFFKFFFKGFDGVFFFFVCFHRNVKGDVIDWAVSFAKTCRKTVLLSNEILAPKQSWNFFWDYLNMSSISIVITFLLQDMDIIL